MPVVIDTDGGIDDAVALWWAITHLDVAAVTTVAGNVRVGQATALVRRVLRECGQPDIPVAQGADLPARMENRHDAPLAVVFAPDEHASAPTVLAELPDGTDLIALGPLTNIAAAIELDPSLPTRLGRMVVMGGPPERAEFNFAHDEEAVDAVRRSVANPAARRRARSHGAGDAHGDGVRPARRAPHDRRPVPRRPAPRLSQRLRRRLPRPRSPRRARLRRPRGRRRRLPPSRTRALRLTDRRPRLAHWWRR
jgi:hypothetical protein